MWSYFLFTFTVILSLDKCSSFMGDLDYDGKLNIKLEHAFEPLTVSPKFVPRGEVAIKSLHTGVNFLEQSKLSSSQARALKELARNNDHYRLRATVVTPDGKETTFLTFVKACAIVESQLLDYLTVNLDHLGNVVAVSLSTPGTCTGEEVSAESLTMFNTSVYVRHMEVGPVPDTASYVQKLEKEREAKDRGETKDNRSFFAKYWMYIVPLVIYVLVSSATNPEAAGGAAQR